MVKCDRKCDGVNLLIKCQKLSFVADIVEECLRVDVLEAVS